MSFFRHTGGFFFSGTIEIESIAWMEFEPHNIGSLDPFSSKTTLLFVGP